MSKINYGARCRKFKMLVPVLEGWIEILHDYIKYFDHEDAPWWYNEGPSVSTLAAAAWATGGIALQDYRVEKRIKGQRNLSKGRCDIFLGTKKGDQFACEAKKAWCWLGKQARDKTASERIKLKLHKACEDAKCLSRGEAHHRLGLCFAVPYFPAKDFSDPQSPLEGWLEEVMHLEYDFIAWCFPSQTRKLVQSEGYTVPGVILLGRGVK